MNKIGPRHLKILGNEPSVSVANVQRVRRQRRLAQTDQEHASVRVHMRDLAGDLKAKPRSNTHVLKMYGIAIIVLGLIIGAVLFIVAFSMWPTFVRFIA